MYSGMCQANAATYSTFAPYKHILTQTQRICLNITNGCHIFSVPDNIDLIFHMGSQCQVWLLPARLMHFAFFLKGHDGVRVVLALQTPSLCSDNSPALLEFPKELVAEGFQAGRNWRSMLLPGSKGCGLGWGQVISDWVVVGWQIGSGFVVAQGQATADWSWGGVGSGWPWCFWLTDDPPFWAVPATVPVGTRDSYEAGSSAQRSPPGGSAGPGARPQH